MNSFRSLLSGLHEVCFALVAFKKTSESFTGAAGTDLPDLGDFAISFTGIC